MDRKPVKSSQIKNVGFDEKSFTLEIEFNRGGIYQYSPITRDGYTQLLKAESVGKHFNENIKNNEQVTTVKIK